MTMQTMTGAYSPWKEKKSRRTALQDEAKFRALRTREGDAKNWNPPVESWYAVRAVPGAQRCPSLAAAADRLACVSVVERNLRNAGIESYMPSHRILVRHHRTKKFIERRFPTFAGYLFVNIPDSRFLDMEAIDGVGRLLRFSKNSFDRAEPFKFPQETIDRLRFEEWQDDELFLQSKAFALRLDEVEAEEAAKTRRRAAGNSGSRRLRNSEHSEIRGALQRAASPSSRTIIRETITQLLALS